MKAHNQKMKAFLQTNGIEATPKYLTEGSLKGLWRLYNHNVKWTAELADKLNALGFLDFQGQPLTWLSGNGGMFSVFVQGHNELLDDGTIIRTENKRMFGNVQVTAISFEYKQPDTNTPAPKPHNDIIINGMKSSTMSDATRARLHRREIRLEKITQRYAKRARKGNAVKY